MLILDKKQKILVVNNENPIFAEDLRERGLSVEETDDKIDMQASYDVIILFGMLQGGIDAVYDGRSDEISCRQDWMNMDSCCGVLIINLA